MVHVEIDREHWMVGKDVVVADGIQARIKWIIKLQLDIDGRPETFERILVEKHKDGKEMNVSTDLVEVAG